MPREWYPTSYSARRHLNVDKFVRLAAITAATPMFCHSIRSRYSHSGPFQTANANSRKKKKKIERGVATSIRIKAGLCLSEEHCRGTLGVLYTC